MHRKPIIMDKSTTDIIPVYREARFRTPGGIERRCGLRSTAGCHTVSNRPLDRLRILGQYAAVAIEDGDGQLLTQSRGPCDVHAGDVILVMPQEGVIDRPNTSWSECAIVWSGPEADEVLRLGLGTSARSSCLVPRGLSARRFMRSANGWMPRTWLPYWSARRFS